MTALKEKTAPVQAAMTYEEIQAFLFKEARALDDRDWDTWLTYYDQNAVFWMPTWDDFDQLTENPQTEMSLIYYPTRSGLEDRVFRIKTDRSSATSMPEPRTSHNISNIEVVERQGSEVKVRFNWCTFNYRYTTTDTFWGTSFYTIDMATGHSLITNKKVILKNDQIHHVIDVYHV
ncbi:benzoate 1,2-dioxygenase small subunit [uncultured Bradyrhizobium sp.]|uniref:benzoate 1,2-dioxygenase small subunit n=1 Tax=uncultured Bradyrhizobium sp. TaxID=199684 RepID=UPI00260ED756|nr:benzoate 1,2-dioxygenase small subunit [uncultured Bradyrhizobium sp.]